MSEIQTAIEYHMSEQIYNSRFAWFTISPASAIFYARQTKDDNHEEYIKIIY